MNRADLLASLLTDLPADRWGEHCVAWVESRGAQCGKPRGDGWLCPRHHRVAETRFTKLAPKLAAQRERMAAERARNLPRWQAQLAAVEADIARLDPPPPTTDRAAWTGEAMGRATARHRPNPDRIATLAALYAKRDRLRRLIGNDATTKETA